MLQAVMHEGGVLNAAFLREVEGMCDDDICQFTCIEEGTTSTLESTRSSAFEPIGDNPGLCFWVIV
jgi:hypothetical protein